MYFCRLQTKDGAAARFQNKETRNVRRRVGLNTSDLMSLGHCFLVQRGKVNQLNKSELMSLGHRFLVQRGKVNQLNKSELMSLCDRFLV